MFCVEVVDWRWLVVMLSGGGGRCCVEAVAACCVVTPKGGVSWCGMYGGG